MEEHLVEEDSCPDVMQADQRQRWRRFATECLIRTMMIRPRSAGRGAAGGSRCAVSLPSPPQGRRWNLRRTASGKPLTQPANPRGRWRGSARRRGLFTWRPPRRRRRVTKRNRRCRRSRRRGGRSSRSTGRCRWREGLGRWRTLLTCVSLSATRRLPEVDRFISSAYLTGTAGPMYVILSGSSSAQFTVEQINDYLLS